MNWRGRSLESHEVIGNTIAATTTRTGLTVHAELDTRQLPQGHRGDGPKMEGLERCALRRHDLHGAWTYSLVPQRTHDPR
jgi:Rhodopirellula transposase DDE domain